MAFIYSFHIITSYWSIFPFEIPILAWRTGSWPCYTPDVVRRGAKFCTCSVTIYWSCHIHACILYKYSSCLYNHIGPCKCFCWIYKFNLSIVCNACWRLSFKFSAATSFSFAECYTFVTVFLIYIYICWISRIDDMIFCYNLQSMKRQNFCGDIIFYVCWMSHIGDSFFRRFACWVYNILTLIFWNISHIYIFSKTSTITLFSPVWCYTLVTEFKTNTLVEFMNFHHNFV